jgi:hypothetical protein
MIETILRWWQVSLTMPVDQLAATVVTWLGGFLIFSVLVAGFLSLWQFNRQNQYDASIKYTFLQVAIPKDSIQTPKGIENFFSILIGAKSTPTFKEEWIDGKFFTTMSFEISSLEGRVGFFIRCENKYRDLVEAALYAEYPEAQIVEVEDYAQSFPVDYPNDEWDMWGSEVVLKKDSYLPIKTYIDFEHQGEKDNRFKDPLLGIIEAMGKMREGEYMCFQLLIRPTADDSWANNGQKYIDKVFGKPEKAKPKGVISETLGWIPSTVLEQSIGMVLGGGGDSPKQDDFRAFKITPVEKEQIDAVARKITKIGWQSKIRFFYLAKKDRFRKGPMASLMKGLFQQYTNLGLNAFALQGPVTPKDDYPWQKWQMPTKQRNLVKRFLARSMGGGSTPKVMNVEELATFWHFPAADARTPVLTSIQARKAEAPIELDFAAPGVPFMQNMERGNDFPSKSITLPARKPLAVPSINAKPTSQIASVRGADLAFGNMVEIKPLQIKLKPDLLKKKQENSADQEIQLPISSSAESDLMYMPKPGMPAPLPPGLDLNSQHLDQGQMPEDMSK